ncbi:MAG: hypothetical protein ABIH00_06530 [Armatimonadota bacterium]
MTNLKKYIIFILAGIIIILNGCSGGSSSGGTGTSSGTLSENTNSRPSYDVVRTYTADNFSSQDQGVLVVSSHYTGQAPSFSYSASTQESKQGPVLFAPVNNMSRLKDTLDGKEADKDLDISLIKYGEYVNKTTGVNKKDLGIPKAYNEGDEEDFHILSGGSGFSTCTARCYKKGDHCYVFIDTSSENIPAEDREAVAGKIVASFEEDNSPFNPGVGIYDKTREYFGTEWSPGIDGDTRIFILISPKLGSKYGYFFSLDETTAQNSNKKEIIYVNDDIFGNNMYDGLATIAHEFQHLINYNMKYVQNGVFEIITVNEGQSVLCEHLNGFTPQGGGTYAGNGYILSKIKSFLEDPSSFYFYYWSGGADYGPAYLFMLYIMERYGADTIKSIAASSEAGTVNIENRTGTLFSILFRDWLLVNYYSGLSGSPILPSGDPHSKYGSINIKGTYTGYSRRDNISTEDYALGGVSFSGSISGYPGSEDISLGQYNCKYLKFTTQSETAENISIIYSSASDYSTYSNFIIEHPAGTFADIQ